LTTAYNLPARAVAADLVAQQIADGHSVKLTVTSESMVPFLQPGDVITVAPAMLLRVGDILVLGGSARPWVHRLVHTRAAGGDVLLVTKGDNVGRCDSAVAPARVLGCVVAVQRSSRRLDLRRGPAPHTAALLAGISYSSYRAGRLNNTALRAATRRLLRLGVAVVALVWWAGARRCSQAARGYERA
jgi:signal peptidase I